jgi:hypothetical protein
MPFATDLIRTRFFPFGMLQLGDRRERVQPMSALDFVSCRIGMTEAPASCNWMAEDRLLPFDVIIRRLVASSSRSGCHSLCLWSSNLRRPAGRCMKRVTGYKLYDANLRPRSSWQRGSCFAAETPNCRSCAWSLTKTHDRQRERREGRC